MASLKKNKNDLETISQISLITSIYQEIAHLRMVEIRQAVLKIREFLDGLDRVYHLAKRSFFASLGKKSEGIPYISKKQGEVAVFLSANEFFYGSLISDIWQKIQEYLKEREADLVVVGRMGKYLAEASGLGMKIFYFELDDEKPERERVKGIAELVKNYKKIVVFHGKFETVLSQNAVMTDISGGITFEEKISEIKNYLFEPSPETVLEFFETETVSALFNQTILEHRLARYATRMMAMYQATKNTKKIKKGVEKNKKKLEQQILDKKQIEIFSGFKLWSQKMEI